MKLVMMITMVKVIVELICRLYFCISIHVSDPIEFEQGVALGCGPKPTVCKFPFIYRGIEYNSCTSAIILEYPYGSFKDVHYDDFDIRTEESFSWCATEVLNNGEMQEGKWGICDPETCDISAPDYEF